MRNAQKAYFATRDPFMLRKSKALEDEMEQLGARQVELENEINTPEVYSDPMLLREKSDELEDTRARQEDLFAAWEAALEEQQACEQEDEA